MLTWTIALVTAGCGNAHDARSAVKRPADGAEEDDGAAPAKPRRPRASSADAGAEDPPADGGEAAGEPPPEDPGAKYGLRSDPPHPIFDQSVVRHYAVEVDPDEWDHINETAYLEEYIEGSLTVDGEVYAPIGLRFKGFRGSLYNCFRYDDEGNATARVCDKLSLKISFNEYDPEGRFFDLKKLNFHAMNNDPSKLRERLAYYLFRRFGVPAPRAVHATLSVNGNSLGLYSLVEQVDGRFTRMRFEDGGKGNVYKERWPTSSEDPEYFLSGLETNEDDPDVDVSHMAAFAAAVRAADDDTIEDVLREYTQYDALMRYLAVDRAINNWDGITAFRCQHEEDVPPLPPLVRERQTPPLGWETCQNKNFYWYEEEHGGPLWLTAWDTDISFPAIRSQFPAWDLEPEECKIQQSGRPPMCDPLIAWFATRLRPAYVAAGRALLDEVWQPAEIEAQIRAWNAQIQPYLELADLFAFDPQSLIDRVAQRRADFEAEISR